MRYTPKEVAALLAPAFAGDITDCEIAEGIDGWAVRVTVQPTNKRRRSFRVNEYGDTREATIAEAIRRAPIAAEVNGCVAINA